MNKQLQNCALRLVGSQSESKIDLRINSNWKGSFLAMLYCISFLTLKAQIPPNAIGPWNINGTNQYITAALYNSGIGTTSPDGKLEVKFKPCLNPQIGVIITSVGCTSAERNNIPLTWSSPNSTFQVIDLNGPAPSPIPITILPVFAFTKPTWTLVKPNEKPLFWIREEDIDNNSQTTNFTSRFIINPNGNTGINTNSPRGTIDVVQAYKGFKDEPTAIFGKILIGNTIPLMNPENPQVATGVEGHKSCEVMIFNNMKNKQRNRIVQEGDQGILFSDGGNSDGSNLNGGLVIAPWSGDYLNSASTVGGIRINKDGKVEVHGDLRATKLNIDVKWWSDFVFMPNYKLMPLSSVNNYIKANGHLPGMPSEKEVLDSGINVTDMQALQQQKIEELTLYSIALEEKLKEQELQLAEQKRKQAELEQKVNLLLTK